MNDTTEKIGAININNKGSYMKIVEYNNSKNVIVEFQDKHKARVKTGYKNFKSGGVKNPYYPDVSGVGYVGEVELD